MTLGFACLPPYCSALMLGIDSVFASTQLHLHHTAVFPHKHGCEMLMLFYTFSCRAHRMQMGISMAEATKAKDLKNERMMMPGVRF